jgi:hypothetical protein
MVEKNLTGILEIELDDNVSSKASVVFKILSSQTTPSDLMNSDNSAGLKQNFLLQS